MNDSTSFYQETKYENCLLINPTFRCCGNKLYTQHGSDDVNCGRIYIPRNESRIIICVRCYKQSPYNSFLCSSDRNSYTANFGEKIINVENFPENLSKKMGNDCKEMLLKERKMFKMGFRVVYHVCNRGHHQGKRFEDENGKTYIHPLFLYQLFGILNAIKAGVSFQSSEFIPFIPRLDSTGFREIPNREAFIERIKNYNDCDSLVRKVGIVGVGALTGAYHDSTGGVVYGRYVLGQAINALPSPEKIISEALTDSAIVLPTGKSWEQVTQELLTVASSFNNISSALIQIFLIEEIFLRNVAYAKNGGAEIRPVTQKTVTENLHVQPGNQLNVYLPPAIVSNSSQSRIFLYTRTDELENPVSLEFFNKVREQILNILGLKKKCRNQKNRSDV
ncbi:MAG: hypothetical protein ACXWM7_03525 [Parachlamydiaceae bacterium]